MNSKYLVLGAGPAGLAFANRLVELGETDFIVLEQQSEAGGLCRSEEVDGGPLDVGGGHFLDVRRPDVTNFLFRYMPETEWNLFERDSRISFDQWTIGHPFESNIWQLPQDLQVQYLKSISQAGCNQNKPKPELFTEWIRWKLGDMIADTYMIPYNQKVFGTGLDKLGTYWLEKLPNVSFEETLLSCLNGMPYGSEPGHAEFYYPKKHGYGELWIRMADCIRSNIVYREIVKEVDLNTRSVRTESGEVFCADTIIFTIPWTTVKFYGMPDNIKRSISKLMHTSVNIKYFPQNMDTKAQWIYYPAAETAYHRILVRSNFASETNGYWTETNSDRDNDAGSEVFKNEFAYPLNTIEKPNIMDCLLSYTASKNVFGLGRWGEWQHYNSDVTVERALRLADCLARGDR